MPDLSHLWQRFMLANALVVGLAIGIAATAPVVTNGGQGTASTESVTES